MADACIAVAGAPHCGLCHSWFAIGDGVVDAFSLKEVGADNVVAKSLSRQSVVMQAVHITWPSPRHTNFVLEG